VAFCYPRPAASLARTTKPLTSGGKVQYEKFLFGLRKL
jgi:hypothetical protein